MRWRRLTSEPLVLAVPAGHRLAERPQVALVEVATEPLVSIRATSALLQVCDALCAEAGFEPEAAFECDDLPTMRGFVAAGVGVAIVPADRSTDTSPPSGALRHLTITDGGAVRQIGMAWSAERRPLPAVELFRSHATQRAGAGLLPGPLGGLPAGPDSTASD